VYPDRLAWIGQVRHLELDFFGRYDNCHCLKVKMKWGGWLPAIAGGCAGEIFFMNAGLNKVKTIAAISRIAAVRRTKAPRRDSFAHHQCKSQQEQTTHAYQAS